jgi:hypothetical protein
MPALWRFGPLEIAGPYARFEHGSIAARILATTPPRFALAETRCRADDVIQ